MIQFSLLMLINNEIERNLWEITEALFFPVKSPLKLTERLKIIEMKFTKFDKYKA